MIIRLGYVAISKTLDNVTSSRTITLTNFMKNKDYEKLDKIIISNLESLYEILFYNIKNKIHFYRITSNLIPLATVKELSFDYLEKYKFYYDKISNLICDNSIRVDMHPGQYCVLNSTRYEVVMASIDILEYHYNLLKQLNIKDKIIILHIGSNTFGKKNSLTRFINQFKKLPKYLQEVLAIENDDRVFTIEDCLFLSWKLDIPVVLDYHHFLCNSTGDKIEKYLPFIFGSWKGKRPKIHFSSPKSKKEYRAHHDYIDVDKFIEFLSFLELFDRDVDIMIEAKAKDEALFRLVRQLKYKTNYHFIDESSFEL